MAIILHEIGHNFSHKKSAFVSVNGIFTSSCIVLLLLIEICTRGIPSSSTISTALRATNSGKQIVIAVNKAVNSNDQYAYIITFFEAASNIYGDLRRIVNYPLMPVKQLMHLPVYVIMSLIRTLMHPIRTIARWEDERIADNFATMHGYGPALATGLEKLPKANPMYGVMHNDTVPMIGWMYDILNIPVMWVLHMFDEHPTTVSRRKEQYNYILSEMKKEGISKKTTDELKKELEKMDRDMQIMEDNAKQFKGTAVQDMYNTLMDKLVRGDDIRTYISPNADWERDSWDKLYDEGLKEHTILTLDNMKLL